MTEHLDLTELRDWMTAQMRLGLEGGANPPFSENETEFNAWALRLFAYQYAHIPAYARFSDARNATPDTVDHWSEIPPVATPSFKAADLTTLPPSERTTVFRSSGTTDADRSRHFHNAVSLSLYEHAVLLWFPPNLLDGFLPSADWKVLPPRPAPRIPFVVLIPPVAEAPDSSLAHMADAIVRNWGTTNSLWAAYVDSEGRWALRSERLRQQLEEAIEREAAVVVLGTAFGLVEWLDFMAEADLNLTLPPGSRVMETGGYKGRTRQMPKEKLHAAIASRLGISRDAIVTEYGMCELSSQAYDCPSHFPGSPRALRWPPWTRYRIVSPETGKPLPRGEVGLVQVFDLANASSVLAIQTEDIGYATDDGLVLEGRTSNVEPKGCSLLSD